MATDWTAVSNVALSGGNLTATGNGAGAARARSTADLAGKVYVEVTLNSVSSNVPGVGIANTSETGAPGVGANSMSWSPAFGGVYLNSVSQCSLGTAAAGDTLCMAIDFPNALAWFRKNSGNWNGNASHNPATNVGGISISSLGSPALIYAYFAGTTTSVTANFGGSAYGFGAPSGFGALSGGAQYNQSVLGLCSPGLALVRQAGKPVRASNALSPAIVRQTARRAASSNSASPALRRLATRSILGSNSPGATLARLKVVLKDLLAAATPAALIRRLAGKTLQGATSPSGVLQRAVGKSARIATAPAVAISRGSTRLLQGAATTVSVLAALKSGAAYTIVIQALATPIARVFSAVGSIWSRAPLNPAAWSVRGSNDRTWTRIAITPETWIRR